MSRFDIKAPGRIRALQLGKRDPVLNNLLDLTAEEILVQWNAANPLEQREILGRALVLLAGIANRINEG